VVGRQVVSVEGAEPIREVSAEDLIRELTQDSPNEDTEEESLLPLSSARVLGEFDLRHQTIKKPLEIRDCEFEGPVSLRYCEFEQVVDFSGCTFQRDFNSGRWFESYTIYKKDLICNNATFERTASFNGARVEGSAYFLGASFPNDEWPVDFRASIGADLYFTDATFEGPVTFDSLKCQGRGYFERAKFLGGEKASFIQASFGTGLYCSETCFEGQVSFESLRCDGFGNFANAKFLGDEGVLFTYTTFGTGLDFSGAKFNGSVDLTAGQVAHALNLANARFEQDVVLYATSIDLLILGGDPFPFTEGSLDLRECTFKRFSGSEQEAMNFAKAQDPTKFSRDPFLQLEKYYESIGNDAQARTTYYQGRRALRNNVRMENSSTRWSWGRHVADELLRVLTGYGVRTWRLLFPISFFILLGLVVFLPSNALDATEAETTATSRNAGEKSATKGSPSRVDQNDQEAGLLDGIAYDLDVFLPVDLGAAGQWEPGQEWRRIYLVIHSLMGWLLVPLLVASLAGIIRRQ
jgi:hypothetical protein